MTQSRIKRSDMNFTTIMKLQRVPKNKDYYMSQYCYETVDWKEDFMQLNRDIIKETIYDSRIGKKVIYST